MKQTSLGYVVSVLKGEKPRSCPEWYETLGFLYSHKIAGLFYNRAEKQELPLPWKIKKQLAETYASQRRRVEYMREQIREVSGKLLKENAEHIFLKGSVLSNIAENALYEDGERISNDVDILVKPDKITAAENCLKDLGFVQGRYEPKSGKIVPFPRLEILKRRMNRGETAPFLRATGNPEFPYTEVDINFSLGNLPGEKESLLAEMLASGKVYEGIVRMRVADEELFFLHLIMHQYKESCLYFMAERGKDLDLYKLADIYYLWNAECFDKGRLQELASMYGALKEVGTVLGQTGRVFGDESMLAAAEAYGAERPVVVDYEHKKKYRWTAEEWERLCLFDTKEFLREERK